MKTPEAYRKHLVFLGRRNAGKSSLFNAFIGTKIAIVSDKPGTTTDPVYKSMELSPIGPVVLVDTAGLDDEGEIGTLRILKTKSVLYKANAAILVVDKEWSEFEEKTVQELKKMGLPFVVAVSKSDLGRKEKLVEELEKRRYAYSIVSVKDPQSIERLRLSIASVVKSDYEPPLIEDLVDGGETVVLVVPIDLGAPKGRLITPQVEAIRECLDAEAIVVVTKERELRWTLKNLKEKPALVVTDSQAVMRVAADVPPNIKMTTFSILEARHKGELVELVRGLKAVQKLQDGDKILLAEACVHRSLADDIARVKIPRWLRNFTGKDLKFDVHSGREYPSNMGEYSLIIHCGGCVITRNMMLRRIEGAKNYNVPITNYGVLISYLHGVADRTLEPFEEVRKILKEIECENSKRM